MRSGTPEDSAGGFPARGRYGGLGQVESLCQEVAACVSNVEAGYKDLRAAIERLQGSLREASRRVAGAPQPLPAPAPSEVVDELLYKELSSGSTRGGSGAVAPASLTEHQTEQILAREFGLRAVPGPERARRADSGDVGVITGERADQAMAAEFGDTPATSAPYPERAGVASAWTRSSSGDVDARLDLLLRSLISREFLPESAVPEWFAEGRTPDS